MMDDGDDPAERTVRLTLPGTGRHVRLARLLVSGIATTYGLSVEALQDTRVAVDEICVSLIETGGGRPLHLAFAVERDILTIRGTTEESQAHVPNQERLAISHRILDVLSERHRFTRVDGQAVFTVMIPLRPEMSA